MELQHHSNLHIASLTYFFIMLLRYYKFRSKRYFASHPVIETIVTYLPVILYLIHSCLPLVFALQAVFILPDLLSCHTK